MRSYQQPGEAPTLDGPPEHLPIERTHTHPSKKPKTPKEAPPLDQLDSASPRLADAAIAPSASQQLGAGSALLSTVADTLPLLTNATLPPLPTTDTEQAFAAARRDHLQRALATLAHALETTAALAFTIPTDAPPAAPLPLAAPATLATSFTTDAADTTDTTDTTDAAAALLRVLPTAHTQATIITPRSSHWKALAPLRAAIERSAPTATPLARLALLRLNERATADLIIALAQTQPQADRRPPDDWRAAVQILATGLAAGLHSLHLSYDAQNESRARDAFISLTAHELRSPLTSIKGYAQLLTRQARKSTLPDAMLRSVESIEQQSLRISEMVSELLDASRIRRSGVEMLPTPVDLAPLARKVIERRRALYPQHTITLTGDDQPLIALVEPQRAEQVLRDLLDNAARHTPADGLITVTLTRDDHDSHALIAVRDAGIGVAPDDRERIFDYLYRSPISESRNLSGLGLGLFVSRYIIERAGGSLWLAWTNTTPPATGSEFRFTLPLTTLL